MDNWQELAGEPVLAESESVPVVCSDSEWSPIGKVGECKDLRERKGCGQKKGQEGWILAEVHEGRKREIEG